MKQPKPSKRRPLGQVESPARFPLARCGLLGLLALAAHATSLFGPFVYDDYPTVLQNDSLREPVKVLTVLLFSRFRPLVNVSYALDHALWGFSPVGFHLTNVVLHALNVLLVFRLAWHWEHDGARRTQPTGVVPLVAAMLFAVHPLMTEAVSYVSGRSELLGGLFFLSTLLAFRRLLLFKTGEALLSSAALLLLGLASKEIVALAPLVAWLYARLWLADGRSENKARPGRTLAPFLAVVAAGAVARGLFFLFREAPFAPRAVWENVLLEWIVLWRYLALLFVPVGQSLVHSFREVQSPFDPIALLAGAGLVASAVWLFRGRHRAPTAAFGSAWFFLVLLPSSSVIPLAEPMSEHRAYVASIGIFLILGAAAQHALRWARSRGIALGRRTARVGLALLCIGLVGLTERRNRVWADPRRLWGEAAEQAPTVWAAQYGLGEAHRLAGECALAVPAYERAASLIPEEPRAHLNLAICEGTLGRLGASYRALARALALTPGDPAIFNNLATLALLVGNPQTARNYLQRAIELDPENAARKQRLASLPDGSDTRPWPPQ